MRLNKTIGLAALVCLVIVGVPSTAAQSDCTALNELNCDSEFQDNDFNPYTQDYERGGLARDYFHTDRFFGAEMEGFPDTAFGENDRYDIIRNRDHQDRKREHGHSGYDHSNRFEFGIGGTTAHGSGEYNREYDYSNRYSPYTGLSRHYGEGFVSGEGFGDEYIGDPDQLGEEIYLWD